jgi:hypothetical protein
MSTRAAGARSAAGTDAAGVVPDVPLVSTPISQQKRLERYKKSVRWIDPDSSYQNSNPPDRSQTTLQGFSDKSRARLRFLAENSTRPLLSQFGLTYHDQWPTDGRECKQHLNAWLTAVRRILPGVGYLWLLEFQQRKAPHFHVFFTVPPSAEQWDMLSEAWCRLTAPDDEVCLWWHGSKRGKTWIAWDMFSANYLTKYLDKEAQKAIPEGYVNFGRFWGNSRDLKPLPERTYSENDLDQLSQVDPETGELYGGSATLLRWLGRLAERQTRGYSRFRKRVAHGSYSMRNGSAALQQIESYFNQLNTKKGLHHGDSDW